MHIEYDDTRPCTVSVYKPREEICTCLDLTGCGTVVIMDALPESRSLVSYYGGLLLQYLNQYSIVEIIVAPLFSFST